MHGMTKSQRQINYMFHPVDRDKRLLSVEGDVEELNA